MVERGGRVWRAVAGLAVAWATIMFIPVSASAVDSDLKHAFAFKVPASNGYSVTVVASNERADGRGEVVLFVDHKNKDESAIYRAPAQLTATSVQADLGLLGKVELEVTPSGKTETIRSRCGDEPETVSFEPKYYRGFFGFYGEEGYTDALSERPREYARFLLGLGCLSVGGGETTGASLPGARLRLHSRRGDFRLDLQASQNHPGKPSWFEVEVHEKRGEVSISRRVSRWGGPDAFGMTRC